MSDAQLKQTIANLQAQVDQLQRVNWHLSCVIVQLQNQIFQLHTRHTGQNGGGPGGGADSTGVGGSPGGGSETSGSAGSAGSSDSS